MYDKRSRDGSKMIKQKRESNNMTQEGKKHINIHKGIKDNVQIILKEKISKKKKKFL